MPFDEDYEELEKPERKQQKTESMFGSKPKVDPDASRAAADAAVNKSLSYKERAADLSAQFKFFLDDKTISSNKSVLADQVEKELIAKMIELSMDMNQDQNEIEGVGTVGWIGLLLRVTLLQKTRINDLEYKLKEIEDKLKAIVEKI